MPTQEVRKECVQIALNDDGEMHEGRGLPSLTSCKDELFSTARSFARRNILAFQLAPPSPIWIEGGVVEDEDEEAGKGWCFPRSRQYRFPDMGSRNPEVISSCTCVARVSACVFAGSSMISLMTLLAMG